MHEFLHVKTEFLHKSVKIFPPNPHLVRQISILNEMRSALKDPFHPRCPSKMSTPPDFWEGGVFGQPMKDQNTPCPKLLEHI